ncbi:MAG TPA: hypothetical protein VF221_19550 [Chloroflexota bacterium]
MARAFQVERTRREYGATECQVHRGIMSLPQDAGPPRRRLLLRRLHWLSENQGRRSKNGMLGEDARLLHADQGQTIVALPRDGASNILRATGGFSIAAPLRYYGEYPDRAAALTTFRLPTRA